jgi:hypothetical protein
VTLSRLLAVALADVRTRLRRPAAAVLVVASAVAAAFAIPDPATGSGLLKIDGARALYTSPALAFATAAFFVLPFSLLGFYVASNALERDLHARIATVVAASPVRSAEYLLGKLLGNVALLTAVALGFMAAAMGVQVVRGEGPLQPVAYLAHYALLVVPCIVWVAAMALVFECAPGLSGRAGDIAYFFVWATLLGLGAEPWRGADQAPSWLGRCIDFTGFGYLIREVQHIAGTSSFTIGYAPVDATRAPVVFAGLSFTAEALGARAFSLVAPALLVPLALVLFRRFDPARSRVGAGGRPGRVRAALGSWLRAVVRPPLALLNRLAPDVALTFRARPILVPVAAAVAVLGLTLPSPAVRQGLLPAVFAVLSLALADVPTRERRAGLLGVVQATPRRREGFARWKLATASAVACLVAGVPVARLLVTEPRAGVSALVGVFFLAFAAVALGLATGTPKTFMALSLALWYLALNAKGHTPALDYGGWWASATPAVVAGWLVAAMTAAVLALVAHRVRLVRES